MTTTETDMDARCTHCHQPILLRPEERTVCEGCRLRGGPPPDPAPPAVPRDPTAGLPAGVYEAMWCETEGCDRFIGPSDLERPDWDMSPRYTRAEKREQGIRTVCWRCFKEQNDMIGEYLITPGSGYREVAAHG